MTLSKFLRHVLPITFVLCLALLSTHLTIQLRRDTLAERLATEFNIWNGLVRIEFQNRILTPTMLSMFREAFPAAISDKSVWFAVRLVQATAAYIVLYSVAFNLTRGRLRALVATGLVAYAYAWTPLTHAWEYPSDFLDILFFALFVLLALREQAALLALLVIASATNRESAAFAGLIWCSVVAVRYRPGRVLLEKLGLGLLFVGLAGAVVVGLRLGLSQNFELYQQVGGIETARVSKWMFYPDGALPLLMALAFSYLSMLWLLPRPWTVDQLGLGIGAIACTAVTLVFGIAGELRVFLPSCTIIALLSVIGAEGRTDQEWVSSLLDRRRHGSEGSAGST